MGHHDLDVLIVDDDRIVAEAIADGVRLAGYRVCGVTSTVDQAVEVMRQHQPRVALVDVDLGRGRDGITAAREMLDIGPVTVIFVTGYPDRLSRVDIGAAWLEKPYRVLDLINALEIITALTEGRPVTVPVPAVLHLIRREMTSRPPQLRH
jgi:DNA-binding response OmpR family regulator